MEWYFEFIQNKGFDATPTITHRLAMDDYKPGFMACYDQGKSAAVKVLFMHF
tara:strand:- start:1892 stop:2047 length:156 start_codon:yes stop_codon:yes gene_type:complete